MPSLSVEEKREVDGRSVYVGNVDYGATAEELEQARMTVLPGDKISIRERSQKVQYTKVAKFNPFLSLDCVGVRTIILQRSVAIVL